MDPHTRDVSPRQRVALAAIVIGTALVRLRLAGMPLERDEGEYAYLGQLILRGEWPYLAAHNMKLPGVYYAYAALMGAFGETDVAIRIGLLLVNACSILLVFGIGRRLLGTAGGLAGAAVFAVSSLGTTVLGFNAKAEHFVVLPALAGLLLLANDRLSAGRCAVAGLLLGLGFVMKQPGAAFVACGAVWIALAAQPPRALLIALAAYAAGTATPFALTCLAMYLAGAFTPFWFWTVTYAREYATMVDRASGMDELREQMAAILRASPGVWLLAGLGAMGMAPGVRGRRSAWRLAALAIASAVAVAPGLRFSEHYFLLLVPAVSLLAGAGSVTLADWVAARNPAWAHATLLGAPALACLLALGLDRANLFVASPVQVVRSVFGTNPFPEAIEIARELAARTAPGERIAIIGSEPEIYFYARRRAATSYIYMYPMMEPQPFAAKMQDDMIAQLSTSLPRYLVLVNVDTSWSRRPDSSTRIMEWAAATVDAHYRPIGLAEIAPDEPTRYVWGDAAAVPPSTRDYVTVFERRA